MSMAPCSCLSPNLAVSVDPALARSKGEGDGLGEEQSPLACCPHWCLTVPCLTGAGSFPGALWGKRLGCLGFVFLNKIDMLYCQDITGLFLPGWRWGVSNPSSLAPRPFFLHPPNVPSAALCSHWEPGPLRLPRHWLSGVSWPDYCPPVPCSGQGRGNSSAGACLHRQGRALCLPGSGGKCQSLGINLKECQPFPSPLVELLPWGLARGCQACRAAGTLRPSGHTALTSRASCLGGRVDTGRGGCGGYKGGFQAGQLCLWF